MWDSRPWAWKTMLSLPDVDNIMAWDEDRITAFCKQWMATYPKTLLTAAGELVLRQYHTPEELVCVVQGCPGIPLQKRQQILANLLGMIGPTVTVEDITRKIARILQGQGVRST